VLDSNTVLVIEPPRPPDAPPPRPRDFVASDNGVASDPGIGMSQEQLDSLRVIDPQFEIPKIVIARVQHKPVLVREVVPEYPRLARDAGIEGMAVVTIVIDTAGRVESARLFASSGNRLLDDAAVAAAALATFKPGYQNGRAVRVEANMPFRFRLN
jgi:protein TonB